LITPDTDRRKSQEVKSQHCAQMTTALPSLLYGSSRNPQAEGAGHLCAMLAKALPSHRKIAVRRSFPTINYKLP
jgi:hypothetical protein